MATERGPIYFLTGAPGVGKSTTARTLADRFDKAIFFDVDYFRQLVVKGLAEPGNPWTEEMTVQLDLAHIAVGKAAQLYADFGIPVLDNSNLTVEQTVDRILGLGQTFSAKLCE